MHKRFPIGRPERSSELLPAEVGLVADDGVEAAFFEDFRESQGPVDGVAVEGSVRLVRAEPRVELVAGGELRCLASGYDLESGA